jgi:hypothetical protein
MVILRVRALLLAALRANEAARYFLGVVQRIKRDPRLHAAPAGAADQERRL